MVTGGSFPRGKAPGREADHSPPASAEVKKNVDLYIHPHMPSWPSAQLVKHRDNFIFTKPVKVHGRLGLVRGTATAAARSLEGTLLATHSSVIFNRMILSYPEVFFLNAQKPCFEKMVTNSIPITPRYLALLKIPHLLETGFTVLN
jgi:hypothetical protein